jgi:precorrin-6B methylase 2
VNLKLFTMLANGKKMNGEEIKSALKFETTTRHVLDWLDVLTTLGFLKRDGVFAEAVYYNNTDAEIFLDKNKPSYIGGILEMANNRLYKFWNNLEEGLQTGEPQNEAKGKAHGNMDFFDELYKDEAALQEFMNAMSGIQAGNFMALVSQFDFNEYNKLLDIGGADGWLCIQVCLHYSDIRCISFDLPPVAPLAKQKIAAFHLSDRIEVVSGDFLKDNFPGADLITMGNILHGVDETTKQQLIKKAYDSLPSGGALIIIENIIDNERRQNTFGLLMSLNMLIENGDAFDYTLNDFERWATTAGFKRVELLPLAGPTSAAIAYK